MTASPGTIYFTTDGLTDPRMIGGGVNPSAAVRTYSGAVPLAGDVTVKARLRTSSGAWSGLIEATFTSATTPGDYDVDGDVDGRDFLVWQQSFAAPAVPPGSGADGNLNGLVDGPDLVVWRDELSLLGQPLCWSTC